MVDRLQSRRFIESRRRQGLDLYPYQVETALRVVDDLAGSAILADEVGLGKTMEAGLIRAELLARRGLGNLKTLVLCPAGLVRQWQAEWHQKFGWASRTEWPSCSDITILSIDTAKRGAMVDEMQKQPWELVVVDEAHHLKNARTLNHTLVEGLSRQYLLLLTATPMENQLTELYTLVNLVKPGLFGPYLRFYRQFILDKRTPKNAAELRALLNRVMVRHQRSEVAETLPPREVTLLPIKLRPPEHELYQALTACLRAEYRERVESNHTLLPLITMQRELCSSPDALLPTLRVADWIGPRKPVLEALCENLGTPAKAQALVDLVRYLNEKVLIFTEYRATQQMLVDRLRESGVAVRSFHGGMSPKARQDAMAWFQDAGQVLVSTEAGGQGINLQFCHHLVNYDLPWNPMRIEQRIGRVHRLGQSQAVRIYNLFALDTVEENILFLLHEKIDLFRQVVGELDVILRHIEKHGRSLEGRLMSILLTATDQAEIGARLDQLAREFLAVRKRLAWPTEESPGEAGSAESQMVH